MERQSQFNLACNFLHVGDGEYVPMRNIRSVELLADTDRAQRAERYPKARQDFKYRIQFVDRSQKLAVELDTVAGSFVQVDEGVLVPIANMQALKPLSESDKQQLKERYPQAERDFQTRIEGSNGLSFLSTWTVAQIAGVPNENLVSAPAEQPRSRARKSQARPAVA